MGRQILRNWSKVPDFDFQILSIAWSCWNRMQLQLVVWNMNFIFPFCWEFHNPRLSLHHFSEGWLYQPPTSYGESPRLEKNLTNSSLSSIGGALKTVRGPSHCGAACDLPFMWVKHFLFFTYFYHPWLGMASIYHLWWWLGDGKHDIVLPTWYFNDFPSKQSLLNGWFGNFPAVFDYRRVGDGSSVFFGFWCCDIG